MARFMRAPTALRLLQMRTVAFTLASSAEMTPCDLQAAISSKMDGHEAVDEIIKGQRMKCYIVKEGSSLGEDSLVSRRLNPGTSGRTRRATA